MVFELAPKAIATVAWGGKVSRAVWREREPLLYWFHCRACDADQPAGGSAFVGRQDVEQMLSAPAPLGELGVPAVPICGKRTAKAR